MAKFFINRPIFAWVVAIFIILAGAISLTQLPVEQYPSVGAPKITVSTVYPGATAEVHQNAVLTLIEREMNGMEGLDYMESQVNANGTGSLTLTFKSGTDSDMVQVEVQNRISRAEPRLPEIVRRNGVEVNKSQSNFLLFAMLYASENSQLSIDEVSDYAVRNIEPELQRVEGVGKVQVFGSERAMRIWLDPDKMRNYGLSTAEIAQAISAQNTQIPAGSIGDLPALDGQGLTASLIVTGQLTDAEAFGNIVLRSNVSGATVRLHDVARVELGSQQYATSARLNGQPAVGLGVQLSGDGNAVSAAEGIREKMQELAQYFPEGINWKIPYDSSKFVDISIEKVFHTLIEAVGLVFLVMFLFLQNIRYTIIPTIVVPISLLGAIALMVPLGMSINVLTMFAMVLVIGIVVDDAIVVVENVERLMEDEKLKPREAALKGMRQISSAVIGITVVLISVFIPMAFFPGATGNIYRQFALVMASAIGFSAFMALSLTPALCATFLKPPKEGEKKGFFGWFNRSVKRTTKSYEGLLAKLIRRSYFMMAIFLAIAAGAFFLFKQLPTSFLPSEDQGALVVSVQLPSGSTQQQTTDVMRQVEENILANEEVEDMVSILGFSFSGQGQNMGLAFISLTDWGQRSAAGQKADALVGRLNAQVGSIREAMVFVVNLPALPELGGSGGFNMRLEARNSQNHQALIDARNQMLGMAAQNPLLVGVRPNGLEDAPQLVIDIDRDEAAIQGVSLGAIAQTLSTHLGSSYVNDFPNKGRMQRVVMQAEAAARMQPEDVLALNVSTNSGEQVALSTVASMHWENSPMQLTRYNGYPAMAITGSAAPGKSSGDAMKAIEEIAAQLPPGFAVEWTGQSLEEQRAGAQSTVLYAFSMLAVFLCLAALYESWSVPFAVLLVIPLGFLGVALGTLLRGMDNDIFFQVGLITVMGLSAKNAILIIEFAKETQEAGRSRVAAALTAAHLRFRPIIMTSIAFIAGVIPLFFATGASAASQRAIGTSVLSGMAIGTLLSIFLVPIFFVVVRHFFKGKQPPASQESAV
ncbi:efflux RND transporter permease subunit [Suttonella sp. R2A3]|uniref:efflux RND transporter permease subunit n=1 Tax=Suttonella sp. R2A3 TaxID=2908648 RepID=UPI001F189D12|nr:efflux RND transporter permease subunit [Suttonella sp. R2A3]UJF23743.1 efflux RND transporter permease subunit [Suttonella sp. R2A3]